MLTTGKALATICWLAVFIVVLAAAFQAQTLMGIAGLIGAWAALGWGLVATLRDDPDDDLDCGLVPYSFGESFDNAAEAMQDDDELPYVPPARAPYWPNDAGAPE